MSDIDSEWLLATLGDASEALADAVAKLEEGGDAETAAELLRHDLLNVYAKLNYAVNTAHLGPEALNCLTEDELIAWPSEMPFSTWEELESLAAQLPEEN